MLLKENGDINQQDPTPPPFFKILLEREESMVGMGGGNLKEKQTPR